MSAQTIVQSATRVAGETLGRAQSATGTEVRPFVQARLREATAALSRVGQAAASAELCNAALQRLAELCYQRELDGGMPNMSATGRIEIPSPMGSAGYQYFGLRRLEQEVLRLILVARMERKEPPALYFYDSSDRRWYVDFAHYPTMTAAISHLETWAIGAREYRRWHATYKAERPPAAR